MGGAATLNTGALYRRQASTAISARMTGWRNSTCTDAGNRHLGNNANARPACQYWFSRTIAHLVVRAYLCAKGEYVIASVAARLGVIMRCHALGWASCVAGRRMWRA